MESPSSTESDEKRDTVPELKAIKKTDKGKGKKPMEDQTERRNTRSNTLQARSVRADVDLITIKARGISINEPQSDTTSASRTKGRRKKIVNVVVRSSYSLRSGSKELDGDRKRKGKEKITDETAFEKMRKRIKRETLNAARKRKAKEETEAREDSGLEPDPEEVCKIPKKGRNNDEDDADKDGTAGSTGAYATRSSTRIMMVKSN